MVKTKEPNALNFFEARQLKLLPPHFEYIDLNLSYNLEETIIKWITKNLRGRFYYGKALNFDHPVPYQNIVRIGFEEPKELSYFTLACPHLKYK
jgi:hypothetical protein